MASDVIGPPIFLVCVARSGSTLLSRLLGAHPRLACPSETMLEQPLGEIEHTSLSVNKDHRSGIALADELIRDFADRTLGAYARRVGKTRWCDKSLTVIDNLDRLPRAFPDAQLICLYRLDTDTIPSALVACRRG